MARTLSPMPVRMAWGAPLTVDDIAGAPDDGHRYEVIDGTLVVTPAPSTAHQRAVGNLLVLLHAGLTAGLEVFTGPLDWVAGPSTVLQPDLLVCRTEDLTDANLQGPPVLIVEVLSPSTRAIDLGAKRLAFAAAGVDAYWAVDPMVPAVTVFEHDGHELIEVATVSGDDAYAATRPYAVRVVPADLVR